MGKPLGEFTPGDARGFHCAPDLERINDTHLPNNGAGLGPPTGHQERVLQGSRRLIKDLDLSSVGPGERQNPCRLFDQNGGMRGLHVLDQLTVQLVRRLHFGLQSLPGELSSDDLGMDVIQTLNCGLALCRPRSGHGAGARSLPDGPIDRLGLGHGFQGLDGFTLEALGLDKRIIVRCRRPTTSRWAATAA